MSDIDHELTKRFAELRVDDEMTAPAFAAMLDHGRGGEEPSPALAPRGRWIASVFLAAAAAVLAGAWVTTRSVSRREQARQAAFLRDSSMQLYRWTMPTDGLLQSARKTFQTPVLSASVLDAAAVPIPGTPFKGD